MTNSILALAFDLDGTLTDSLATCSLAIRRAFELCDLEAPNDAELGPVLGLPLRSSIPPLLVARDVETTLYSSIVEHYRSLYPIISRTHTKVFPGIETELQRLYGILPLGVVTSKSSVTAKDVLKHTGLLHYFDVIIGSDTTERLKPYAEPLLAFCQSVGTHPALVVMIGDAAVDMEMAVNAASKGVGVDWGHATMAQLEHAGACGVVSAPSEIASAIDALLPGRSFR